MMKCERRCDKKRKLEKADFQVKQHLKDYTLETSKKDLAKFMKLHGSLASATMELEQAREAIRTCEGSELCRT